MRVTYKALQDLPNHGQDGVFHGAILANFDDIPETVEGQPDCVAVAVIVPNPAELIVYAGTAVINADDPEEFKKLLRLRPAGRRDIQVDIAAPPESADYKWPHIQVPQ